MSGVRTPIDAMSSAVGGDAGSPVTVGATFRAVVVGAFDVGFAAVVVGDMGPVIDPDAARDGCGAVC